MTTNTRVDSQRVRTLRGGEPAMGPILCWLDRDRRARDNWALLYAQDVALARSAPLGVVCATAPRSAVRSPRQDRFALDGLHETARELASLGIPLFLLRGDPGRELPAFAAGCGAGLLVADFQPLRASRARLRAVCARVTVPVHQVDAHNVVPAWVASGKQEYGARTLRPKLHRQLPRFLTDLPGVVPHPHRWPQAVAEPDWTAERRPTAGRKPGGAARYAPGEAAARAALERFVGERLAAYAEARNDPTRPGQSDLSPYLNAGQLAPQRAALAAAQHPRADARQAFLEELIVRRELSDNYCLYNEDYDRWEGLPAWGRRTLERHADDPREQVYDRQAFAAATTHEALWNAAQTELVLHGKLHGYLRMYWAKKILEWSRDPAEALQIAVALNDRYALDGRDPNGYVGCAWSIGGLHDRPWAERPVFGQIRFMNLAGCRRKFKVDRYVAQVAELARTEGA